MKEIVIYAFKVILGDFGAILMLANDILERTQTMSMAYSTGEQFPACQAIGIPADIHRLWTAVLCPAFAAENREKYLRSSLK